MKPKNYHAVYEGGSYWYMTLQGAINACLRAGGGHIDVFNYPTTDKKVETITIEVQA